MNKLQIQANLSVERSGGPEKLSIVIEETERELKKVFPDADIAVRKGYFKTIDGIWANDPAIEEKVREIVYEARKRAI